MRATQAGLWHRWWPFILLCLVRGSRWMASEALPGSGSTLATEALGCGSAAALCMLLSGFRDRSLMFAQQRQVVLPVAGGALLLAGPLLGLLLPGAVSGASLAMALALTPVVLGVVNAATRHAGETLPGRLWPGLAAIAGLLLLLAEPSLSSLSTDVILMLVPVLTGCGAALFCSAEETPWRLPLALLGACGALGTAALLIALAKPGAVWPEMRAVAAGLDALEAFLAVLALGRVSAARWSAQFALVPLLVLLEGVATLHSGLPARMVTGLLLLGIASAALLMPPSEESTTQLGFHS